MFGGKRAAQFAGDKDGITLFRAGPQHALSARHPAEQRDGDKQALGAGGGLTADNRHLVPSSQRVHAGVNGFHRLGFEIAPQAKGYERGRGRSCHGGDVA